MRFPAGLRALNHRDFRLFFAGQLVSLVGTWMQSVGQAWLVLELTNSPFLLGLVGALQFSPMLVLSFVTGVIADRVPKRRMMLGTQSALMLQALALSALVYTGHVRYWHVAVLASLLGIVNTFDMPVRQSFIVEMASKEDLTNAIALNSAVFNSARVVGPAVAGVLVGRYGVAVAFLLNGASFLAVLAALLAIRAEGLPHARGGRSIREEILEGVVYAVRTPIVTLILSLLFVVSLFVLNYNVLVPLLARDVLHQQAQGYGFLMGVLGAGALSGAVALALLGSEAVPVAALVLPALVLSLGAVGVGFVHRFASAAVVLFVMGFAGILFMAGCNSTLQLTVPDRLRGRMMSLYMFVFVGVTPIGSLVVGAIAEAAGVSAAFVIGGGLGLLSVLALVAWWHRRRARPAPRFDEG